VESATKGGWARRPLARTMRAMKLTTRKRRRAFIQSYEFPSALRVKLREKLDSEYQVARALEGLREWYLACLDARGETLGMPSRAVDIAWHEMILMTRAYHAFCDRAFGYYLHHSPDSVLDESMRDTLARTLALVDGRSAMAAGVPLLFAIDDELGIEDGYAWDERDIQQLRTVTPSHHVADYGGSGVHVPGCGSGDGGGGGGGGCGGGGCGGGG
jgi:hypothetical protein